MFLSEATQADMNDYIKEKERSLSGIKDLELSHLSISYFIISTFFFSVVVFSRILWLCVISDSCDPESQPEGQTAEEFRGHLT